MSHSFVVGDLVDIVDIAKSGKRGGTYTREILSADARGIRTDLGYLTRRGQHWFTSSLEIREVWLRKKSRVDLSTFVRDAAEAEGL